PLLPAHPPPTLCPYTTLFRSHDHAPGGAPHGGSDTPGGSSHEAPCPFAASGKPAFAPAILTLETAASAAAPPEAYATAPVFLPTVLRAQSPRGPPLIA